MAYIYEIINDVNNKRYIGKTEFDINKRFAEHCNDAFKDRNEKRPLYRAIRKYGVEHFHINLIEETNFPEEREIYWINEKQTFHNGYNATIGGDGKRLLDYDLIIKTYNELLNLNETSKACGASVDAIRNILKSNNVKIKSSGDIAKEKFHRTVGMYDKTDHSILINTFLSTGDASQYLIDNNITSSTKVRGVNSHIVHVCNGQRESAYGYWWQYLD